MFYYNQDEIILIHYEVDGLAHIASKFAHFFLDKKLDNSPVEWDAKNEEIRIDLSKIVQLNAFLKIICISEIQVTNNAVVLEMYVRGKI